MTRSYRRRVQVWAEDLGGAPRRPCLPELEAGPEVRTGVGRRGCPRVSCPVQGLAGRQEGWGGEQEGTGSDSSSRICFSCSGRKTGRQWPRAAGQRALRGGGLCRRATRGLWGMNSFRAWPQATGTEGSCRAGDAEPITGESPRLRSTCAPSGLDPWGRGHRQLSEPNLDPLKVRAP